MCSIEVIFGTVHTLILMKQLLQKWAFGIKVYCWKAVLNYFKYQCSNRVSYILYRILSSQVNAYSLLGVYK